MRKIAVIMVLGLALLLMGLTLSASAATVPINDKWAPYSSGAGVVGATAEQNLYAIVDQMLGVTVYKNSIDTGTTGLQSAGSGLTLITSGLLPATTPTGTWTYTISSYYASYAGFTQDPGSNPAGSATATLITSTNPLFPTSGNMAAIVSGFPSVSFATPSSLNMSFADYYTDPNHVQPSSTKYTQSILNSGGAINGLIFQVGSLNEYIICFEDGDSQQPLGDWDYNDLVLFVNANFTQVPLPPSALLLGTGLLGLVGLGWRRRNNA